jgi:hypothetical protein
MAIGGLGFGSALRREGAMGGLPLPGSRSNRMESTCWPLSPYEPLTLDDRSDVPNRWSHLVVAPPEGGGRLHRWLESQRCVVVSPLREIVCRGGSQANRKRAAVSAAHCVVAKRSLAVGRSGGLRPSRSASGLRSANKMNGLSRPRSVERSRGNLLEPSDPGGTAPRN